MREREGEGEGRQTFQWRDGEKEAEEEGTERGERARAFMS